MSKPSDPQSPSWSLVEGATLSMGETGRDEPEASEAGPTGGEAQRPRARPTGTRLGRYRLEQRLGGGGMGMVYEAYDPELDRRVALKLIRPAPGDSQQGSEGRARLLREAQAMARLQHPNVISVYDLGTLEDEVFVAMELVRGDTLAEWLEERTPSIDEILRVFVQAGRGLAAAHAADLVHRDFKPENVLVGDDGRVRVLDFGLARPASAPTSTPAPEVDLERTTAVSSARSRADGSSSGGALDTPLTRTGTLLGTPAYMSPEQHQGRATDARSDQFSFCVALYEALYREPPFEGESYVERRRAVLAGRTERAARRARGDGEAVRVPARVAAALDRGLAVEPADRFASMEALLIELEQRPLWRSRFMVAAAALVAGLAATGVLFGLRSSSPLCTGAEARMDGVWDAARRQEVAAVFTRVGEPRTAVAGESALDALDRYARDFVTMHRETCEATRVRGEQSEEILTLRMLCLDRRRLELDALVGVFLSADARVVARSVDAVSALEPLSGCENIAALRARVPPPSDPVLQERVGELQSRLARARALRDAGRIRDALDPARELVEQSAALGYRPLEARCLLLLGEMQQKAGQREEAEVTYRKALVAAQAGRDDEQVARVAGSLLSVIGGTGGRAEEAQQWGALAAATVERMGGDEALQSMLENALGTFYLEQGKSAEGLEHLRRAVALRERVLGPEHPMLGRSLSNLGAALYMAGRHADALPLLERAVAIREPRLGAGHPEMASTRGNLGLVLESLGRFDEAQEQQEKALRITEEALGPDHPRLCASLENLANLLMRKKRYEDAEALYRRSLAIAKKAFGPDDAGLAITLSNLGGLERAAGHLSEALELYEEALAVRERGTSTSNPELAYDLTGMGETLVDMGRARKAVPPLERALALRESNAVDPVLLAGTRFALARALRSAKWAPDRARRLAEAAREAFRTAGAAARDELTAVEAWLGQ